MRPDNALMPVTARVLRDHGDVLSPYSILHINHALDDVEILDRLLASVARRSIFVPIDYTRHRADTYVDERNRANPASASGKPDGDILADYASELDAAGQWLVIEDGARFSELLFQDTRLASQLHRLVGFVEQTTAGERLARERHARHPPSPHRTISVARSRAKNSIEPHLIADRVCEELGLLLAQLGDFLAYKSILVTGYGMLGRSVAHKLRTRGCRVGVSDIGDCQRRAAQSEGFRAMDVLAQQPVPADIVVGVTGHSSFPTAAVEARTTERNAPLSLVSASSRQFEFSDALDFLNARSDLWMRRKCEWGIEYVALVPDRSDVRVIADGLPVNFFRPDSNSLAIRVADLINAELVTSALCLCRESSEPRHGMTRFGIGDHPQIGAVAESRLIDEWCATNNIQRSTAVDGGYPPIGPHPCVKLLVDPPP
jgi:S-adenosylhomocysteine hydrolase